MSESIKLCVAHFNIVDGKPTLWDTPQPDSVAMNFIVSPESLIGSFSAALTDKPENMVTFFNELEDNVGIPESFKTTN